MFYITISYFNTSYCYRNVVVIFGFSYHVENLAVVSSRGSGHLSRDLVQLCLVIVCLTKSEGKQRPTFLVRILL